MDYGVQKAVSATLLDRDRFTGDSFNFPGLLQFVRRSGPARRNCLGNRSQGDQFAGSNRGAGLLLKAA